MHERDTTASPSFSRAAFTTLVDRHAAALHAFLRGMTESAEQAHDLAQDTFHDAWRTARAGVAPFAAGSADDESRRWLFHTAYCKAVSALRRRRLIAWESLDLATEAESDLAGLATNDDAFPDRIAESEAVRAALARLAPPDAACLLLRVVYGFSAAEVGQIVGASAEVVTKRLSRARQRLRAAYLAETRQAGEPICPKEPAQP
jgi:RNA polymerase sigma-70 factor, ECF subfamily